MGLIRRGCAAPETAVIGEFEEAEEAADVNAVQEEIKAAFAEEQARQERINDAEMQD